jgi:PAS domain-containing protein
MNTDELSNLVAWINQHGDPLSTPDFATAAATLGLSCLLAVVGTLVCLALAKRRRASQRLSASFVLLCIGALCAVTATLLGMTLWFRVNRDNLADPTAITFAVLGVIQVTAGLVYARRTDRNQGTKFVATGTVLLGLLDYALPRLPDDLTILSLFFLGTTAFSLMTLIGLIVEELSRQSELKYRTVFEGSNEAMVIVGLWRYAILDANEAAQRLFKLPTKLLLGRNFLELCPQLKECTFTHSAPYKFFTAVFRPHNEFPMVRADGSTVRCRGDACMVEWRGKMAVQLRIWERDRHTSLDQMTRRTE